MIYRVTTTLVTILLLTLPTFALAIGVSPASDVGAGQEGTTTDDITTLKQVTVVGQTEDSLTGSNSLGREQLDYFPAKNSSINEAISILPGIQLPEEGRTSVQGGEILPPLISISGGKSYQNNYLIDGATSNNLISPSSVNPKNINFVPGHSQTLFLDTRLVEEIEVYRYNIPSSFGSFTGGVVDIQTRRPTFDFWGEANYRTTQDAWTKMHVDDSIKDEFESSNTYLYQPEFERHDGGLILNIPLNNKFSLLTAYQINYSEIPLQHIGQTKNQKRRNENFLTKLLWQIDSRKELITQLQYAPYQADYFITNSQNSDYTIEAGSVQASLTYKQDFDSMEMTLFGAGKTSRSDRDSPPDLRSWLANVDGEPSSKPWGNIVGTIGYGELLSKEGGVGSLESSQDGFQLKADFVLKKQTDLTKAVFHQINFGAEFDQERGTFDRKEPTSVYFLTTKTIDGIKQYINANPDYIGDVVCPSGASDCIDGEQVLLKRQYYAVGSSSATVDFTAAYIEDKIEWKQLNIRAGIRLSYDNFMNNLDIAPRLASSYDLFNDGSSLIIAGWNRYYGRTLLHYKLREASQPYSYQTRLVNIEDGKGIPGNWSELTEYSRIYKYSELDTPYSDEVVIGLDQELFGGRLKLNWVRRDGNDEFSRERTDDKQNDGKYHYTMTNIGSSRHNEYTLEWERYWQKCYLGMNVTYQETEASNESYLEEYETEDLETNVWYEGDIIFIDEIPRQDFSRPWVANLVYSTQLPYHFTFTNITKFRSGYEGLSQIVDATEKAGLGVPSGMRAYHKDKKDQSWIFDWRLDWEKRIIDDQALVLSLEINNVFDQKVELGDPSGQMPLGQATVRAYELGRQFWLGMTYKF